MTPNPLLTTFVDDRRASRIWAREPTAFLAKPSPDAVSSIDQRLGWLDAPAGMAEQVADLTAFAAEARRDHLTHVYLLGMGGSSLCAEVLRDVPLVRDGETRLTVLDTTDERTIREATDALVPTQSLFIVASKSGGTIEVTSLERHFWGVMSATRHELTGAHFVAITDPETSLVAHAAARQYRRTFVNPADIGGRYSALSLFGLVPAALLGIDIAALLRSAGTMAGNCRADREENPGLALGAFLAHHASAGRDKMTVILPPSLEPLGAWIEQLVAESTGKNGRGILPVVGEPIGMPNEYGKDRAIVSVVTPDSAWTETTAARLEQRGHPVFRVQTTVAELGGEFFRWEFATAVAGAGIGVNPFDEPNVKDAKMRTQAQLDARRATGIFKLDPPFEAGEGYQRRESRPSLESNDDPQTGRYVAILDYFPAEARRRDVIERLRAAIRRRTGLATTYGVGPRYLHSTGQYHKGGPNTGLFLLFTAADASGTPIPDTDYTFATLKHAQALGDFEALIAAGRDVIHYHVENPAADFSAKFERVLLGLR